MDTTLTLPWESEQTATTETSIRFEALDFAGVLTGCIADVGFAATDKHRWGKAAFARNRLFADSSPYRD
jgi:hypothetical protein